VVGQEPSSGVNGRAGAEQALATVGLRAAVEVVPSCADGAGCPVTLARDRGRVWRQDVPADATLPVGSTVGLGVGP